MKFMTTYGQKCDGPIRFMETKDIKIISIEKSKSTAANPKDCYHIKDIRLQTTPQKHSSYVHFLHTNIHIKNKIDNHMYGSLTKVINDQLLTKVSKLVTFYHYYVVYPDIPKILGSQSGIRIYVQGCTGSAFFPVVSGT